MHVQRPRRASAPPGCVAPNQEAIDGFRLQQKRRGSLITLPMVGRRSIFVGEDLGAPRSPRRAERPSNSSAFPERLSEISPNAEQHPTQISKAPREFVTWKEKARRKASRQAKLASKHNKRMEDCWSLVYHKKLSEIHYLAQLNEATKLPDIGRWSSQEMSLENIIQRLGNNAAKTSGRTK